MLEKKKKKIPTPGGLSVDQDPNNGSILHSQVVPLRSYDRNVMSYSSIIRNPIEDNEGYTIGIGTQDAADRIKTDTWGNMYGSINVGWNEYHHSDYNSVSLSPVYNNSDTELILRNNTIANFDLSDDSLDWYDTSYNRFFSPIIPDAESKNILTSVSYSTQPSGAVNIFDQDTSTSSALDSNDFTYGSAGEMDYYTGNVVYELDFTNSDVDIGGFTIFTPEINPARHINIQLLDNDDNVLFNRRFQLLSSQRVGGTNRYNDRDELRPPQPMFIPIPKESGDNTKKVRIQVIRSWWFASGDMGRISEIYVHQQDTGTSDNMPKVYELPELEFVERIPEFDDNEFTTNQLWSGNSFTKGYAPFGLINNGDDAYIESADPARYYSAPPQSSSYSLTINYSNKGNYSSSTPIKSMRWNFGYQTRVFATSAFVSSRDGEKSIPEPTPPDNLISAFIDGLFKSDNAPFIILCIAVGVLLEAVAGIIAIASAGLGLPIAASVSAIGTGFLVLAGIQIGWAIGELVAYQIIWNNTGIYLPGHGYTFRNSWGLMRDQGAFGFLARGLYDWVLDTEGTLVRIGFYGARYDFARMEWNSYGKNTPWVKTYIDDFLVGLNKPKISVWDNWQDE